MTRGKKATLWTCAGIAGLFVLGLVVGPPPRNATERSSRVQAQSPSAPQAEVTSASSVSLGEDGFHPERVSDATLPLCEE